MRLALLSCLGLSLIVGCGGATSANAPRSAYTAPSGGGPTPISGNAAAPADAAGYAEQSPPATAAPPAPPQADESSRGASRSEPTTPAPEDRPGLGTQWGETRESRVHDVTFTRANGDHPFAIASMFYNDRAGVEALARFHGGSSPGFREYSARGGAITVSIRDSAGRPLDALRVADRTYVVGESGERYSVFLTNHTAHRFEAVATVDGLDVVNGHAGDLSNRGYVLSPFATLEIDGFRQSQDAVAAFRFAKVSESYAAKTGEARNVGVIGVAFFGEQGDDDDDVRTRDTANPFPGRDPRYAQPPR
jgi:hypothetical protein